MNHLIPAIVFLLAPGAVHAADITLRCSDGTSIHALYEPSARGTGPGVVLVHAEQRSAADWSFEMTRLSQLGFFVVAPDLRGHGANIAPGATAPVLDEATWAKTVQEVAAAVQYLRTVKATTLNIVGASFGATLALSAAAADPDVDSVVLLSPMMTLYGLSITSYLSGYGTRPLLVAASQEDQYSAKTAIVVDAQATGPKQYESFQGAGHGVTMLNREPSLEGLIVSWISGSHGITTGTPTQGLQIGTGTLNIQTSGPTTFTP